jgi:abortive infection bacteriophage resistance protein
MTDVQKAGFLFLRRLRLAKVPFTKLAATPEQLLQKLETRGLIVSTATQSQALAYLRFVGGYRLKGYWFHVVDPSTKQFPAGYTFEQISDRCELDRELRAATITAIDRLEVAIRSVMANFLSLKHSPHWFLDPSIFKPTRTWGIGKLIKKIEDEVGRSESKRFVGHYYDHHDDPYLPPSWAISECVTFGLWSRTFAILRDATDKKAISKKFGIDQADVFESWIHTLTVVRNIAAHHGQFLKVKLGVSPSNYKAGGIKFSDPKSFYAAATVIQYLLSQTGLPHNWKADLNALFNKYPSVQTGDLGFPANWQSSAGW